MGLHHHYQVNRGHYSSMVSGQQIREKGQKLVESMPKRVKEVLKSKAGNIRRKEIQQA